MDTNYNTINYYNISSQPPQEKGIRNFPEQDDMIKMMENLNLGQSNNIFNSGFGVGQMKTFENEDDNQINFNQDLNQLNQGNNFSPLYFMNNENQKKANKNKKKK